MNLHDPAGVKALLARHGVRVRKSLGQNFLVDPSLPERIAESCGASKDTGVFEIGPGVGILTIALAKRARQVLAMEIDRALLPVLAETLAESPNVRVLYGDALRADIPALAREHLAPGPFVACANLPYYITTPVLSALLDAGCFESVTVMVQKEVAERMAAPAGSGAYGAFSVYIAYHARPELLFHVPAHSFFPKPRVDSAVIRLHTLKEPPFPVCDKAFYFKVVHAAFGQRRKTLANALSSVFSPPDFTKDALKDAVVRCGFPADIRGERLSPLDFSRLSAGLYGILTRRIPGDISNSIEIE